MADPSLGDKGVGDDWGTTPLYNFGTIHSQRGGAHTRGLHLIVSGGLAKVVMGLYIYHFPNHICSKIDQIANVFTLGLVFYVTIKLMMCYPPIGGC
jgi:hypothetical protein